MVILDRANALGISDSTENEKMDAIFETVEQALQVSFLVISLPSRQKNTFRMALIQMLETVGKLSARQAEFLEYLLGSRGAGKINFDGLNGEEVRAQCAMVVAAVRDRLPDAERNAIWIRYARGIPARPEKAGYSESAAVPPSMEWKRGVFETGSQLRDTVGIADRNTVMALIAAHAFPHQRENDFSYANISRACGTPVRTLERAAFKVRQHLRDMEASAVKRLTPSFQRDGLVLVEELEEVA